MVVWLSSSRCPPADCSSAGSPPSDAPVACASSATASVVAEEPGVGVTTGCRVPVAGARGVAVAESTVRLSVVATAVPCSVAVSSAVDVADADAVLVVAVAEGVGVSGAGAAAVPVGVGVEVAVAVGVAVAVAVGVLVLVTVGVGVLVLVAVGVGVLVDVAVGVGGGALVGVAVAVAVGVAVGGACSTLIDSGGPPALAVIVPAPVTEQTAKALVPDSSYVPPGVASRPTVALIDPLTVYVWGSASAEDGTLWLPGAAEAMMPDGEYTVMSTWAEETITTVSEAV